MNGFLIFAAVVTLSGLTIWLIASVVVTLIDSENAAKIIAAMGAHFPLRRWWRR
ncbi:hypothetical protein [Mycobacterium sp.]|uniref:hypothetical protein n=1 Tax=Mycobacterium sp. TaxID=1785 RepID=UPI003F9C9B12